MMLTLYSNTISDYLKHDNVVDFDNESVAKCAESLFQRAGGGTPFIRAAYEFVRDEIAHSADIGQEAVPCSASEVIAAGHGICFAKSHLLAALLRCKRVPAGFCYQTLLLDDDELPVFVCHGLVGVYIEDCKKWIRLDCRGNKAGVNAQFSMEAERLAFPVRTEKGEKDSRIIYPAPDAKIVRVLRSSKTRTELWRVLPSEVAYATDDMEKKSRLNSSQAKTRFENSPAFIVHD